MQLLDSFFKSYQKVAGTQHSITVRAFDQSWSQSHQYPKPLECPRREVRLLQEVAVVCPASEKLVEIKAVYEVEQAVQLLPGLYAAAHCTLVHLLQSCTATQKPLCTTVPSLDHPSR